MTLLEMWIISSVPFKTKCKRTVKELIFRSYKKDIFFPKDDHSWKKRSYILIECEVCGLILMRTLYSEHPQKWTQFGKGYNYSSCAEVQMDSALL